MNIKYLRERIHKPQPRLLCVKDFATEVFLVCYDKRMNNSQELIKKYLDERDWNNLVPADIAKSIMIEGAELLELFQWKNHTVDEINADPALKLNMQKEIADVIIYATELAIHLDINVTEAIKMKIEHNAKKYPALKIKDSKSGDDFYMDQKMKYRKEGK